jgi:hypothetical protein
MCCKDSSRIWSVTVAAITIARQLMYLEPTLFIAIGGGGFIPARILRTFLKTTTEGKKRNIPIQAVGLTLYESMGGVSSAFPIHISERNRSIREDVLLEFCFMELYNSTGGFQADKCRLQKLLARRWYEHSGLISQL